MGNSENRQDVLGFEYELPGPNESATKLNPKVVAPLQFPWTRMRDGLAPDVRSEIHGRRVAKHG